MDLNLANSWPWLAGGVAAIAGGWGLIRSVLEWLSTLFVGRIKNEGDVVAVCWFVWNKCFRVPVGALNATWTVFNRDGSTREYGAYESPGTDILLVFYGIIPLIITDSSRTSPGGKLTISYIRGTINPAKFLKDIQRAYKKRTIKGRFRVGYVHGFASTAGSNSNSSRPTEAAPVQHNTGADLYPGYRPITHSAEELTSSTGVASIDELSLDDDILEAIKEIEQWLTLKDWYKEKGIPWRRGWLLTGKPGTGKSTLVKSLAKTMDVPVMYFDLSTFLNSCFMSAWKEQSANTPFIALFEDIDAVFNKRDNLNKTVNGGLTFDCFLNAIAGADTTDGIFTVITTNDITKIDPALAVVDEHGGTSRPGRIDRILDLKTLSSASRTKIAKRILKDHSQSFIDTVVSSCDGFTAAQFTEVCVRRALKEKWNK